MRSSQEKGANVSSKSKVLFHKFVEQLERIFKTKIKIKENEKKKKGKIEIEYYSPEDFGRIIKAIMPEYNV